MTHEDRRIRGFSRIVLVLVALCGAVLSYTSLYHAALGTFGPVLAALFPITLDLLVAGSAAAYVASCRAGHPRLGWRWICHGAVAGTIIVNALASPDLAHVPFHIVAPAVWSVLVEMVSRDAVFAGVNVPPPVRIPFALWVTAPRESFSTALRTLRQHGHASARLDVGHNAAALEALRLALPGRKARRVRKILERQLRAGSLPPSAVLARSVALMADVPDTSPRGVLRDVLATALPQSGPDVRTNRPVSADGIRQNVPDVPDAQPARELSGMSKREAVRYAHRESGLASTPDIMRWLSARGVTVSKSDAYAVAREVADAQNEDTRPIHLSAVHAVNDLHN
jgi:hypothetical protein